MFSIIVAILILMALLLAAVGGLGLTTTMSINMIERIREIGVLRAIGASNFSVRQIVLAYAVFSEKPQQITVLSPADVQFCHPAGKMILAAAVQPRNPVSE